ncbi:hypothetical protein [Streptomyces sp. KR55]|uniref:hypothetical protein n=1 Tax=Streptomyces sp. KR55 TaxID=3457425 RepID=UPI003FD2EB2B
MQGEGAVALDDEEAVQDALAQVGVCSRRVLALPVDEQGAVPPYVHEPLAVVLDRDGRQPDVGHEDDLGGHRVVPKRFVSVNSVIPGG